MRFIKNDKGYAMLIVLFLIFFIMIVSAIFLRNSISNAKQEKKVDENNISVVFAEMGVEYYSNLFTNIYLEVRKETWNEQYSNFIAEKTVIENDNKLSKKEMESKIKSLAEHFRDLVYKEISDNLKDANINPPEGIQFDLIKFDPQRDINKYFDSNEEMYVNVFSRIEGVYKSGKLSQLEMDLNFFIPSMLEDITNIENGNSLINPFDPLEFEPISKVTINKNCEKNKRYQKVGSVNISCFDQSFIGSQIQQNTEVNISTNFQFQAKQIQQNYNGFKIVAGEEFISEQIDNNGFVTIVSGGNFVAKQIQQNKGLKIITNSKFTSEQLSDNVNSLLIKAIGDINTKQIQQNNNSFIKTNSNFKSEQIQQNTDRIVIEVGNNFSSKQIDQNNNLQIIVNNDFESEQIQQNKTSGVLKVGGKFESKQIQQNDNMKISVGGNFKSEQIQQNDNMSIFINGNYDSKHVEQNEKFKLIVRGDLKAEKLSLKPNSLVCAGGNFSVSNIDKDSTSKIYLLKNSNQAYSKYAIYVDSDEWVSRCGMELGGYETKWKNPEISVDYLY